jgi:hypothetical protein
MLNVAWDLPLIDDAKVRDYLLSMDHPVGYAKALFFQRLGFSQRNWERLRTDIERLAIQGPAEPTDVTPYGRKYRIRGLIRGPNGRSAAVHSVWMVRLAERQPRLVTIIPIAIL